MKSDERPFISIVVPVLNEAESIPQLHAELLSVLLPTNRKFEIIYIDDGSRDNSYQVLTSLQMATVIRFSRNFGKSQALSAGFEEARGMYIITMDGDLQDDPHEISNFVHEIEKGNADMVVGWKRVRLDPKNKKIASRIANRVTSLLTGVRVHDMNCGFKIYKSEVAKELLLYGDLHRFIPAIAASLGYRIAETPVNHRARRYGVSKYGVLRLFTSLFDFFSLIFLRRFTDRPMHFFGGAGLISGISGLSILLYLTGLKITTGALIGHRPLLQLGVLLMLLGVQLLSLGFVGDLVIRSGGAKARTYVIKERSHPLP